MVVLRSSELALASDWPVVLVLTLLRVTVLLIV
jgi:hypothetical protein